MGWYNVVTVKQYCRWAIPMLFIGSIGILLWWADAMHATTAGLIECTTNICVITDLRVWTFMTTAVFKQLGTLLFVFMNSALLMAMVQEKTPVNHYTTALFALNTLLAIGMVMS